MKLSLSSKGFEQLAALFGEGEARQELCEVSFVDREIAKVPENNFKQIIPYITFYTYDAMAEMLSVLAYKRTEVEGYPLSGKASIGWGGRIDSVEDIVSTITETVDGVTLYKMTAPDLLATARKAGVRELIEEIGINPEDLGINMGSAVVSLMNGDQAIEVNQVHTAVTFLVQVTKEQMDALVGNAKPDPAEIQTVTPINIDLGAISHRGTIPESANAIAGDLQENNGFENWSAMVAHNLITTLHYAVSHVRRELLKDPKNEALALELAEKVEAGLKDVLDAQLQVEADEENTPEAQAQQ